MARVVCLRISMEMLLSCNFYGDDLGLRGALGTANAYLGSFKGYSITMITTISSFRGRRTESPQSPHRCLKAMRHCFGIA